MSTTADMSSAQRLKLMQMACVAAWSDLAVQEQEKAVIMKLAQSLELPEGDRALVRLWLDHGAPEFDPYDIPRAHRGAFLDTVMQVVEADGTVDPEESETIRLLRELAS